MRLVTTFTLFLIFLHGMAQENTRSSFRKYPVESTGCNVYLPVEPGKWTLEQSEDGSDVYTLSEQAEGFSYDIIAVQFGVPFTETSGEDLQSLLISYMDFLKQEFKITESVGYAVGQQLPGNDSASGVLDYWKDADGSQCKVKGWITETHLAVLMVTGMSDPSEKASTDVFLNGFRFPEKQN